MRRYFTEVHCDPVGLYRAAGIDVFDAALLMRDGSFIQCPQIQMHGGNLPDFIARYRAASGQVRVRAEQGTCVLLLGPGHTIYGHWLVDFLPKLFVLHMAGYDLTSLTYLIPADTPPFGLQLLDLLGITAGRWLVYDPQREQVRAELLLIPGMVRTNSRTAPLFADAIRYVTGRIWQLHTRPAVPEGRTRIFVSRSKANRQFRHLLYRERVEQIAAEAGFAIVHPEQMPLLEQFALFAQARQIMGEYGSALHGSIFAGPEVVVAALRGNGSPVAGFLQSSIGESLRQPTGYVFDETAVGDPAESFTLAEHALRSCLQFIFGGIPLA